MKDGLFISFFVALFFSSLVVISNRNNPEIKIANSKNKILWTLILMIHWLFITHTYLMFSLIYPDKLWWLFPIYANFTFFHWKLFKDECIINYLEKKVLNPEYKLGDDPHSAYYWAITGKEKTKWTYKYRLLIFLTFMASNAFYMLYKGVFPGNKLLSGFIIVLNLGFVIYLIGGVKNLVNNKESFSNQYCNVL